MTTYNAERNRISQCRTCGVERDPESLPNICPICADERQYLAPDGKQHWVDPADFPGSVELVQLEPGLWGLNVEPKVGIGQQAKVIATADGVVMMDVPAAITASAVDAVRALGRVRAIVPSHPHMFGVQSLWSEALDGAPVLVAEADRKWLGRVPENVRYWSEPTEVMPGVRISQAGGHFPGSAVMHWPACDGRGVLLTADTVRVNPDRTTVAFMWSYPNQIPLSAAVVTRIASHLDQYDYDRVYGNFVDAITADAKRHVQESAKRHTAWVGGVHDDLT